MTLLVSVTTKFDVPTVERIIEKLENIRDAVVNGQTDDDAHEVTAVVRNKLKRSKTSTQLSQKLKM